jgi:hypothetical protein
MDGKKLQMKLYTHSSSWLMLGLLALLASCTGGAKDTAESPAQGSALRPSSTALALGVKPLAAADNPYSGKYEDWDKWAYANLKDAPPGVATEEGSRVSTLAYWIDANHFMVPLLQREAMIHDTMRAGDLSAQPPIGFTRVVASGDFDLELSRRCRAATYNLLADYYPRVPDWVATKIPEASINIYPNGEVFAMVRRESRVSFPPDAHSDPGVDPIEVTQKFYRFSADGELIAEQQYSRNDLFALKASEQAVLEKDIKNGFRIHTGGGFMWTADKHGSKGGKIQHCWNYAGERVDPAERDAPRDWHNFVTLSPTEVQSLREAQFLKAHK